MVVIIPKVKVCMQQTSVINFSEIILKLILN